MLTNGFTATSVDDVCKEAGLTKGSLFHYFATKEALGAAVLAQYLERVFAKLDEIRATESDPLSRVSACLRFLSDCAEVYPLRHGCILGRFTQELFESHATIRVICAESFERWILLLEKDLEAARKKQGIRGVSARALAEYTLATFEGAVILARASGDCAVVRRALEVTRCHLETVLQVQPATPRKLPRSGGPKARSVDVDRRESVANGRRG